MYRTFDFLCKTCGSRETRLINTGEDNSELQEICQCGQPLEKTFSIPNVRTAKLSTSFIDGQRSRTKEFQQLKRQDQLENTLSSQWSSGEEKREASKELKTLTGDK